MDEMNAIHEFIKNNISDKQRRLMQAASLLSVMVSESTFSINKLAKIMVKQFNKVSSQTDTDVQNMPNALTEKDIKNQIKELQLVEFLENDNLIMKIDDNTYWATGNGLVLGWGYRYMLNKGEPLDQRDCILMLVHIVDEQFNLEFEPASTFTEEQLVVIAKEMNKLIDNNKEDA